MASIIEVSNLTKTYTYYKKQAGFLGSVKSLFKREKLKTHAVKRISFSVKQGELIGFLGPNGAGKTTTLKMLSGILYPTSGDAKVLGFTPWERKREYQKQFSIIMGQKNQLWWDLPAMDSFLLNKEIYEVPDGQFKRTLDELVELLDVRDILDVQVRKLSLGQRMKCELIAALLHNPKVLFLDEPTIGLDVVSQQVMRDFIKRYNEEWKTTILLTSHYMEDVEELCKRVVIIDQGKIMYDGALQTLIDKYADYKVLTITFTKSVDPKELASLGAIREANNRRIVIAVDDREVKKVAAKILKDLPVDDLLIDEMGVDEVIRRIFTEKQMAAKAHGENTS